MIDINHSSQTTLLPRNELPLRDTTALLRHNASCLELIEQNNRTSTNFNQIHFNQRANQSPYRTKKTKVTFLHGFGVISNAALKSSRCCDVSMVRGLLHCPGVPRGLFLSSYFGLRGLVVPMLSYSSLLNKSTMGKKTNKWSYHDAVIVCSGSFIK